MSDLRKLYTKLFVMFPRFQRAQDLVSGFSIHRDINERRSKKWGHINRARSKFKGRHIPKFRRSARCIMGRKIWVYKDELERARHFGHISCGEQTSCVWLITYNFHILRKNNSSQKFFAKIILRKNNSSQKFFAKIILRKNNSSQKFFAKNNSSQKLFFAKILRKIILRKNNSSQK